MYAQRLNGYFFSIRFKSNTLFASKSNQSSLTTCLPQSGSSLSMSCHTESMRHSAPTVKANTCSPNASRPSVQRAALRRASCSIFSRSIVLFVFRQNEEIYSRFPYFFFFLGLIVIHPLAQCAGMSCLSHQPLPQASSCLKWRHLPHRLTFIFIARRPLCRSNRRHGRRSSR